MLPRSRRLRSDRAFTAAWRSRWVVRGPALVVRVSPSRAPEQRIGFTVSKATAKHAVDRNKIKRRLRAASSKITWPAGHNLLIVAQRPALNLTYAQLSQELDQLVNRAFSNARRRRVN